MDRNEMGGGVRVSRQGTEPQVTSDQKIADAQEGESSKKKE